VGLIVFTDDIELYVPPQKGSKHVLRVIREVLYFEPKGKGTDIPKALHYLNNVIRRKAVVFLVSDFMADNYETALRVANRRHDVVAVTVTDPREHTLPNVGLVAVRDAETGRETLVNTGDARVRAAYEKETRAMLQKRDEILRRNRVDTMHTSTDTSYVEEIYRFFKMRERRRSGRAIA
jgi:uncharacterized protein (DUF58 family)